MSKDDLNIFVKGFMGGASFLAIVFLLGILLSWCNTSYAANKKTRGPRWGDTVCWYNSVKEASCATMGWSNVPSYAKTLAKNKCMSYCKANCKLIYCEKLTRNNFAKNEMINRRNNNVKR